MMVWIKNQYVYIVRGLLILAIAIFFSYRYYRLQHGSIWPILLFLVG
jgi:hypothetical protein